jgi:hypothetical protein
MNELWNYIIFKIKGDEIKKINVHGVIRKICPRDLIKSSMRKPEFGNGQVMDDGVTGYGRGKIKENCSDHKS